MAAFPVVRVPPQEDVSEVATLKIRQKLPKTLTDWRDPGDCTMEEQAALWRDLPDFFATHGITLWPCHPKLPYILTPPTDTNALSSGFSYIGHERENDRVGGMWTMLRFEYNNPINYAGRTREGHDVIIRVLVIGEHGRSHLDLLRRIATAPLTLFSDNHTLPLLREIAFHDIVFGVFPKCGGQLGDAYAFWPNNSVGDVVNMIMQALEALVFIHERGIAHRDAFKQNFLVQWHPESRTSRSVAVSPPRVYLIDFEVAVEFPPECPLEERRCVGLPSGSTILPGEYSRPVPSAVSSGEPYDPFKLDVWQLLGVSFCDFQTTIPAIDAVLTSVLFAELSYPFDAATTLKMLADVVNSLPPEALNLKPIFENADPRLHPEAPAPRKRSNSC